MISSRGESEIGFISLCGDVHPLSRIALDSYVFFLLRKIRKSLRRRYVKFILGNVFTRFDIYLGKRFVPRVV